MLKKSSLRLRLTLLSAVVTVSVAVAVTAASLVGANRIFVRGVQQQLDDYRTLTLTPSLEPAPHNEMMFTPSDGHAEDEPTQDSGFTVVKMTLFDAGKKFNLWGIAGLALITLLGTGATWLMAGRALKPVRNLSAALEEISGKDLSRRVEDHGGRDEIGCLARSFNAMMDQVSASFERQKRFSASAAHELKTPLANMQLGLEVLDLDEEPDPQRMKKALAVARANTSRLIDLVDGLFRLSAEADCEMDQEMSAAALFSEILEELSPAVQAKGLGVSVSAAPDLKLRGNRALVYRALFNLAENAVKYNRQGGVISLIAGQESGAAVISVSDNGIGIPAEELEHIFEPFYRVDRSRARAMGGSGLGLALVREIMERHGGSVSAESTPGEGSTFTIRFCAQSPKD